MSDTEGLRKALDHAVIFDGRDNVRYQTGRARETSRLIKNAARRWLALAEGDEAVVERVANIIREKSKGWFNDRHWFGLADEADDLASSVIAAITEEKLMGADLPLREPGTVALEEGE